MASLVDTNVLVYAYDPRSPGKQRRALDLLQRGAEDGTLVLPYQAVVEFVAVTTRPVRGGPSSKGRPLLEADEALRETDQLIQLFEVLYPTEEQVRRALQGSLLYEFSWYDALLWACADVHEIGEILSEDFQDGRHYGKVCVVNPFRGQS